MKEMGMDKMIIKNINVLTPENKQNFISLNIKSAFEDCVRTFGIKNVLILSQIKGGNNMVIGRERNQDEIAERKLRDLKDIKYKSLYELSFEDIFETKFA